MNEKLNRFIAGIGNISTAASVLDISKVTLKKYLLGNDIPKMIWNNKISPIIDLSLQDLLEVLANRINELQVDSKNLSKEYYELLSNFFELERSQKQLSISLDEAITSPLMCHIKNYDPITNLEKIIDRQIADENCSRIYLYHAFEEYAITYELFRPYKINRDDYYWNTVSTMDKIYAYVYSYLGVDPIRIFSSIQINNFILDTKLKTEFNVSDWKVVKQDLEKINTAIRKTRNKESVRLFAILGKKIPYGLRHYITEYTKSIVDNVSDDEINIGEHEDFTITLRGQNIVVKSEPELFCALMEINKKTK